MSCRLYVYLTDIYYVASAFLSTSQYCRLFYQTTVEGCCYLSSMFYSRNIQTSASQTVPTSASPSAETYQQQSGGAKAVCFTGTADTIYSSKFQVS